MINLHKELLAKIDSAITLLKEIENNFIPSVFSNSFGAEDMVLTDILAKNAPSISMITLDTGRLPAETYLIMEEVKEKYSISLDIYFPDSKDLEPFLNQFGPNAFYSSGQLRRACCKIRKILPLKRALSGKKAWITGMRKQQSVEREDLPLSYFDQEFQLHKFNPLIEWTTEEIWDYIRHFKVPYHPLHDQNYPSISCAPCTRSIKEGEDLRAGRWWWENTSDKKECGIHFENYAATK